MLGPLLWAFLVAGLKLHQYRSTGRHLVNRGSNQLSYRRWNYWNQRRDDKSNGVGGREHRTMFANPPVEDFPVCGSLWRSAANVREYRRNRNNAVYSSQHHISRTRGLRRSPKFYLTNRRRATQPRSRLSVYERAIHPSSNLPRSGTVIVLPNDIGRGY